MQIDTTMIITPLVEEEMAERESPLLIVRKTLNDGGKVTKRAPVRISTARADGLTTPSRRRKMSIALAATEQTHSIV